MPRRSTVLRLVAVVVAVVALAAYAVWWSLLAHRFAATVADWVAARRGEGLTVETGPMTLSGFPMRVKLVLAAPAFGDKAGNLWRGPPLTLWLPPWAPSTLHLSAPGIHRFGIAGGTTFTLAAGSASARLRVEAGEFRAADLIFEEASVGRLAAQRVVAEAVRLAPGRVGHRVPSLSLTLEADGLTLPVPPPAGAQPLVLRLHATAMGWPAPAPVKAALAAWRDDGGTVELNDVSLRGASVEAAASGTFALDGSMQPLFAGTLTTGDSTGMLGALADSGVLDKGAAAVASLALGALSHRLPDGSRQTDLPLSVQNRTLSLGPLPLAHLPQLSW